MLVVEGGHTLEGTVACSGSKNAFLPIAAAALLTTEPLKVTRVPDLADANLILNILEGLGCEVHRDFENSSITIQAPEEPLGEAGWEDVRKMRGSVYVLGPLLARTGAAKVSLPGGCVIGQRPIDLHLRGLEELGAKVEIDHGHVVASVPGGRLTGAHIYLGGSSGSSVGATANIMMAACLADGETIIEGAACEPEVVDLGRCLIGMGATIEGLGSPRLSIQGVEQLGGCEHEVIPDRIEAGTYVIAGAMTGGRVKVEGCDPGHLSVLLARLHQAGVPFEIGDGFIETQSFNPRDPQEGLRATDVTTLPYPGFPTDLQAQWMALMTLAPGISVITEKIYPDRYMHMPELLRLGADLRRQNAGTAIVVGGKRLSGAPVTASDLRASAALVLAGLVAEGVTEVHRVYHIDRGYERIEDRLRALGAVIRRESDPWVG
jgi:UDP-N-acetylglucosamine 1-carboxyvinyltransferase